MGIRPTVRGTAMNPVDHPHGGGEGKQGRGLRRAKSKWGKPTGKGQKTRTPKKYERASFSSGKVGYGHHWVEIENGRTTRTSLDHLIAEHHLDKMAVEDAIAAARQQYKCGRQEAIDRIHGWCHGERSTRY